jgi:cell division protein FtsA
VARGRIIVGVDIGSTKITTVVGEVDPARGLVLRGIKVEKTSAITRGMVTDINQASIDIDTSYSGAIYSSGLNADEVFVGITGRDLLGVNCHAELPVSHPEGEVEAPDVEKLLEMAQPRNIPAGRMLVHTLVRQYYLDNRRINRSPIGMIGRDLAVDTHVVTGSESQIKNLERALERVQLRVRGFAHTLVAAGEVVLTDEERQSGAILIDFGGGTTSVGIFLNGSLNYSACIPIGSQNYDQDLKQGLGLSYEEAQRLKKSYGKAWIEQDADELDDFVDVKFYGRREYDKVKRRRIFEIMQPRTDELMELILTAIDESGIGDRVAGGTVICGGGSQLRQLRRYLQKHLGKQVRMGVPVGVRHVLDEYRTPVYAPALGLLCYGEKYEENLPRGDGGSFVGEVIKAAGDIFKGLFKGAEKDPEVEAAKKRWRERQSAKTSNGHAGEIDPKDDGGS